MASRQMIHELRKAEALRLTVEFYKALLLRGLDLPERSDVLSELRREKIAQGRYNVMTPEEART